jgi:predicted RNase H-like HicB family nuclease
MDFVYVLQQEAKGDYSIYSPQFPVSSSGKTKKEAIQNFQEAFELYRETMGNLFQKSSKTEFGKITLHA